MTRIVTLIVLIALVTVAVPSRAQLVINEANAVSADKFIETGGTSKPYEGYDYGSIAYSGNTNLPTAAVNPGNPFASDVDGSAAVGTTLSNGWNLANPTGWARVQGNGGDWIELVVTQDHLDMRGWTLYWENDETDTNGNPVSTGGSPGDGIIGSHAEERGFIKFTQNAAWSNLRAGTIITMSEDDSVDEIRDQYHNGSGSITTLHDTGHNYDLSTDLSFIPDIGDFHIHFHVNENLTDNGIATDYFEAYSDMKVDNDAWRAVLFDSSNTALAGQVENTSLARGDLDLTTGIVGQFVGESAAGYGNNTGGGGINGSELLALDNNLTVGGTSLAADYEDVDFSTFGKENMFNVSSESTLDGVQNFDNLRSWWLNRLPGDANLDGVVNLADLQILGDNWQATGVFWADADFTADDVVNLADLQILGDNWQAGADVSFDEALAALGLVNVPEPTSLLLLGAGAAWLIRRQR